MRNILSLLALSMSLVACNAQNGGDAAADPDFQNVDVERAQQLMQEENPLIVDVRTEGEYAGNRIAGAKHINWYGEDFEQEVQELPRDKPVLLYCHSGGRSSEAMSRLKELGFEKVYNLEGGISAWKKQGKPVETKE